MAKSFAKEMRRVDAKFDDRLVQNALKAKGLVEDEDLEKVTNTKENPDKITSANDPGDDDEDEDEDQEPEVKQAAPVSYEVTAEQIKAMVHSATAPLELEKERLKQQMEKEVEAAKQAASAELEEVKNKLKKTQDLNNLMTRAGVSPLAFNGDVTETLSGRGKQAYIVPRKEFSGADYLKEMQSYEKEVQSSTYEQMTATGQVVRQSPREGLERLYKDNPAAFMEAMDKEAKAGGLLRGSRGVTQAGTTSLDISPLLLKSLAVATQMRMTTTGNHNWLQFVGTTNMIGRGAGEAVEVPRFAHLAASENPDDYTIGRDDDINSAKQPVSSGSELITLEVRALGKAGLVGNTNQPVSIARFFEATSLIALMPIISKQLYETYLRYQTAAIRAQYNRTTRKYYNKNGTLATLNTQLAAGDGAQMSLRFLEALCVQAADDLIPAYSNGKYAMQLGPSALMQLRQDLRANEYPLVQSPHEEIRGVLNINTAQYGGDTSPGYVGNVGSVMLFETNTCSLGVGGSASLPAGGSNKTFESNYFFGADAVAHASAMPFSIITDSNTNFSLRTTMGWASIETFQAIDVDPALSPLTQVVKQQQRVYNVQTSRTAV